MIISATNSTFSEITLIQTPQRSPWDYQALKCVIIFYRTFRNKIKCVETIPNSATCAIRSPRDPIVGFHWSFANTIRLNSISVSWQRRRATPALNKRAGQWGCILDREHLQWIFSARNQHGVGGGGKAAGRLRESLRGGEVGVRSSRSGSPKGASR